MNSKPTGLGEAWKVQNLRLSLFLASPIDLNECNNFWRAVVGQEPAVDENRPREALRLQVGPYDESGTQQIEVHIRRSRIDWLITPVGQSAMGPEFLSANIRQGIEDFASRIGEWLKAVDLPLNRIAVGAAMMQPVENKEASYGALDHFLKSVTVDSRHSKELFYQINWPLESKVIANLQLNRITKWNSLEVRAYEGAVGTFPSASTPVTVHSFCALECDHSTAIDYVGPFTQDEVQLIIAELCELIIENAECGEIVWSDSL